MVAGVIVAAMNTSVIYADMGKPEPVTEACVSSLIAEARDRFGIPAIAVAVMNAQTVHAFSVQGHRVHGRPDAATRNDFFHTGSCSKSVLAVMAARLVAQGKVAWDTRFFDLFPEFRESAHPAYAEITLEDLFLCRAGIRAFTYLAVDPLPPIEGAPSPARLKFIEYLVAQPPASRRTRNGFEHLYSNASYTMASAMLERAAQSTYEELVTMLLTDEMGLAVHIGWPNGIHADQPWGHLITRDGVESFPPEHEYRLPPLLTPAGDLSMPASDYARYTQWHLQGLRGASDFLSQEAWEHIHFGHAGFSIGVGNGVMGGRRYSGFDGSAGTFFCRSIVVPESDFAFCILMNAGSGTADMKAVDWLTMRLVKKQFDWWWKFWL